MEKTPTKIDLDLWFDKDIIPRQNQLKATFWKILGEVGNSFDLEELLKIHPKSRGVKLSKGNELLGYPYQVLDLIRDFNLEKGLNIRILNWFGHGLFLFVLLGKDHSKAPFQELNKHHWLFDLSPSPWEYPETLLSNASTQTPSTDLLKKANFYQWHKSIPISEDIASIKSQILDELNKIIFLLS